ncbi:mitochondrial carrier protein [Trypanosoma theileri]|uniref:Mitochondrial carrier protein n=1 Tax=Trypanosoma theileri TaxID=67003 RepID=A0A1X0NUM8_9TRYP|nr:mitochondrial carrier protein [Trypanosoma theileri]ORC88382.1 mitochondrial carrier protein [Trypanosoma theileri]
MTTSSVGGSTVANSRGTQPSPVSHTISSQLASAASTFIYYPFDTLRIRFMSQDGTLQRQHNGQTYHSISKALTTIYREEGLRALFRGCHIAVMGAMMSWGVYMYLYRSLCSLSEVSSYIGRAGVSAVASLIATFFSSPIWLIKSRMQIEEATKSKNYVTFHGGVRHVLQTTGFRSLWRGVSLQLTLVIPNSLNVPTYDFLKGIVLHTRYGHNSMNGELSVLESSLCSMLTKTFLVFLSHPITVLKVRLQDQRWNAGEVKYRSVHDSILLILKREGARGMLRGLGSSLLHSLPRTTTYFVIYEKTLGFFSRYA